MQFKDERHKIVDMSHIEDMKNLPFSKIRMFPNKIKYAYRGLIFLCISQSLWTFSSQNTLCRM